MMNITKSSFVRLLVIFMLFAGSLKAQINTPSGATNPFGSNQSYGFGVMPNNLPSGGAYGKSQDAADAYNEWKAFYVDQTCAGGTQARVKFDDVNATVSEGIAYGMLLSAYAADKTLFDKLWAYYKANSNGNNIMNWKINGCSGVNGANGATDAELDAAMALIIAEKQWPLLNTPYDYGVEATNLITKTKSFEMDNGSFQAINGDGWGFSNTCRNPSYQAPAYYKAFATQNAGEATFWNNSITGAYTLLNNNAHATTGLVSDWSDNNGNKNTCNGGFNGYGYDACRNPWRMAVDVLWWNNTSGAAICNKLATYINGQGVGNVRGPRNSDGTGGGNHNATFVSTYAAAVMGTSTANQTLMNNMYTETKNTKDALQGGYPSGYFGNTLRCVSLFTMTGNFWKPGTQASQEINVTAGAVDVLANSTYDFQNVQNASNKSVVFTVENKGSVALTIGSTVFVTGAGFTVTAQPGATTLNGGVTTTFTVRFAPGSNGIKTGNITITSNDTDEPNYVINLTGNGTTLATNPEISVLRNATNIVSGAAAVSLGTVTYNSTSPTSAYFTYTINNTGDGPLNITAPVVTGTGYTLDLAPAASIVATTGTTTFRIKFTPVAAGTVTGSVSIANNDVDEATFVINLSANVVICNTSITSTNVIQDYDANNNLTLNYVNANFTTIANPFVTGANLSNTANRYIHPASSSYDGVQYKLGCGGGSLPTTSLLISMLVYSPQIGVPVVMNLKDPSGLVNPYPSISSRTVNTTKANQWERLYFNHSSVTGVQFVEVFVDPTSTKGASGAATYYLDDIRFEPVNPCVADLPASGILNDFEDHKNISLVYGPGAPSSLNEVTVNPNIGGLNTSNIVAQFTRGATGAYATVRYAACNAGIFDLSTGKTVYSMLVYSPYAGAEMLISLKNAGDVEVIGVKAKTTLVNTWERLYFDFGAVAGNTTVKSMDIFPDPTILKGAGVYYFDEIKYDVNPCYLGISGTGIMQDFNANRFLSSSTIALNDLAANPSATGINTSTYVGSFARPGTGLFSQIRFQPCGTSFDLSPGKTVYAMDVYSPVPNLPITMLLKQPGGLITLVADSAVVVAANTWTTVTFDFTGAISSSLGAFLDVYIDPNILKGAQTYYIDNIRFAPAAPEINVKQDVTNILTGGTFNLGTVNVGSSSAITSFTIQNNGTGNLTLSGAPKIAISGANMSEFVIDQTTVVSTVGPVSSTTFTITFSPTGAGVRTALISIANSDGNENPYTFTVTGTGAGLPEIDVKQGTSIASGGNYAFGSVNTGASSGAITFTIDNLGFAALNLSGTPKVVLSGANMAEFTVVQPVVASIAAAGSTTFTVSFNPTSTGAKAAVLTIANNDANEGSYVINLSGTATLPPAPEINVTDGATNVLTGTTYDLGSAVNGSAGATATFTIENLGTATLTLSGGTLVAKSGTNSADFAVTQPSGSTIAAAGSRTFTVTFNPSAVGVRTAVLTIVNNDGNEGSYVINLTATGTAAPAPEINVTESASNVLTGATFDMGSLVSGSSGTPVTFTIENLGTAVLTLSGGSIVAKSGTNAADFTIVQPSSASVAASGNVTFTVAFNPSAVGTRTAILTIVSNDANEASYTINLTGNSTVGPLPEINVQASSVNYLTASTYAFGNQATSTGSAPVIFTIENNGTAALTISSVTITGAASNQYSLDMTAMTTTVAAGGTTTVSVTFAPTSTGSKAAALVINNSDANEGTYTINLSGTGIVAAGINEALNASAKLSPNPFSENIVLELGNVISGNVSISVKNMLGEEVQNTSAVGGSEVTIQLNDQPSGVYAVEILTAQGTIVKRIVKQ